MSLPFKQPPLDGSVTVLPGFVDFHAEHNPNSVWAVFPSLDDPNEKTCITYSELAQASHRIAHAVRPGRKGSEQEVVAILVNCDTVHYVTFLVGLRRAGIVVRAIVMTPVLPYSLDTSRFPCPRRTPQRQFVIC